MNGAPATGPRSHFLSPLLGRFDKRRGKQGPRSQLLPQRNKYRTGSADGLALHEPRFLKERTDSILTRKSAIADCRLPTARYYDTNMKKIIFLLLLAAVGVVAYKYFTEEGY